MNIHDPREFADAFRRLDVPQKPEAVRALKERKAEPDKMHTKSGKAYVIENGEFKPVED